MKIKKIIAIDKKAIVEIIFSARNSESRNCFFKLSLVKVCLIGDWEFILFYLGIDIV
ncbi:hypothetical protein [Flavobacterium sp. IMCC34518]|uniref:hypothetical protein n=1 Tax=Flavobacterium sp. IMCC34518 TaxID=3003623 RepID=UPI0022AC3037|nr:hypothetical protein [Flavobacterium sp. IMCC34518]